MSNSTILNNLSKSFKYFENFYENSNFNKLFLRIDKHFANWSINSNFARIFLRQYYCSNYIKNSKLYLFITTIKSQIRSNNIIYVKYILNSNFFGLILSTLSKFEKYPFKIIGLFGSSFLITNIIIQLLLKGYSTNIIIKLFLLCGFIVLCMVNISFKKALHGSYFLKNIKKFIYQI